MHYGCFPRPQPTARDPQEKLRRRCRAMLMPYLGNDTVYTKNKAAWRDYFKVLVEENRPLDGSDYAACQSLAPKLSATAHIDPPWTANYLLGVLHKTIKPNGDPSPVFRMAVIDLAA